METGRIGRVSGQGDEQLFLPGRQTLLRGDLKGRRFRKNEVYMMSNLMPRRCPSARASALAMPVSSI
jgi:hypothetical protein